MKYEDVLVADRGKVFDLDGNLIEEASVDFSRWNKLIQHHVDIKDVEEEFREKLAKKGYEELPPTFNYVYGFSYFNVYPYGHLWDHLQRLKVIEDIGVENVCLCLSKRGSERGIEDFYLHLELFGYSASKIKHLDCDDTIYKIPTLYCPDSGVKLGVFNKETRLWVKDKYSQFRGSEENLKLYLSRKGKPREAENEDVVIEFLKERDFTIVYGNEGIREHVRQFSNATFIVGIHGALFMNIIFCEKNPIVMEFCPNLRYCDHFLRIGRECEISDNYHFIVEHVLDFKREMFVNMNLLRKMVS